MPMPVEVRQVYEWGNNSNTHCSMLRDPGFLSNKAGCYQQKTDIQPNPLYQIESAANPGRSEGKVVRPSGKAVTHSVH